MYRYVATAVASSGRSRNESPTKAWHVCENKYMARLSGWAAYLPHANASNRVLLGALRSLPTAAMPPQLLTRVRGCTAVSREAWHLKTRKWPMRPDVQPLFRTPLPATPG